MYEILIREWKKYGRLVGLGERDWSVHERAEPNLGYGWRSFGARVRGDNFWRVYSAEFGLWVTFCCATCRREMKKDRIAWGVLEDDHFLIISFRGSAAFCG